LHFDHVGAVARMARDLALPIEGPHPADRFLLDTVPQWCSQFGFPPGEAFLPDRWLQDGDAVQFGDQQLEVRHCPGHTPGHVIFFNRAERVAIVGDVIFRGSIGGPISRAVTMRPCWPRSASAYGPWVTM